MKIDGTHHQADVDHLQNRGGVPWGALLNSSRGEEQKGRRKKLCNCEKVYIRSPHLQKDPHKDGHDHEAFLIAKRAIKKGEELMWSYSVAQSHRRIASDALACSAAKTFDAVADECAPSNKAKRAAKKAASEAPAPRQLGAAAKIDASHAVADECVPFNKAKRAAKKAAPEAPAPRQLGAAAKIDASHAVPDECAPSNKAKRAAKKAAPEAPAPRQLGAAAKIDASHAVADECVPSNKAKRAAEEAECKCVTTCVGICINAPLPVGAKRIRLEKKIS